jgi:hypothetical protein
MFIGFTGFSQAAFYSPTPHPKSELDLMEFRDLHCVEYDKDTEIIDAFSLARLLPNTPTEVREQFYVAHGRKDCMQAQYATLEISSLQWSKVAKSASEVASCSYYEEYATWYEAVGKRATQVNTQGWSCIDSRRPVVEHWQNYKTWQLSPVFLHGNIVGSSSSLHLVEGHTRVGLLCGLVSSGIIQSDSMHQVWLGARRT